MKKLYYVECDSERCGNEIAVDINDAFNDLWGFYTKKKDAHNAMVEFYRKAKKQFADRIAEEKKDGNTITIDLWVFEVDDDFDLDKDDIWEVDERQLLLIVSSY